jgi:hypothetical protein
MHMSLGIFQAVFRITSKYFWPTACQMELLQILFCKKKSNKLKLGTEILVLLSCLFSVTY